MAATQTVATMWRHVRNSRLSSMATSYTPSVSSRVAKGSVQNSGDVIQLEWSCGRVTKFHAVWLRDHCPQSIHPDTKQREVDTAAISTLGDERAAQELSISNCGHNVSLTYGSGHRSCFTAEWLLNNAYWKEDDEEANSKTGSEMELACGPEKTMWDTDLDISTVSATYSDFVSSDGVLLKSLDALRSHGIVRIQGCPLDLSGTEAVAARIGRIRETLYGRLWDTAPKDVPNDTAYTNIGLPLHTDCTYMRDPPGLQMLHCVAQARKGGANTFVDGFRALERLRERSPEAFTFFCETPFPFYCVDDPVHLRMVAPVIEMGYASCADGVRRRREVVQLRFNNSDRGILSHLNASEAEAFYEHWYLLNSLIHESTSIFRVTMCPGDTIIFDNHRVLHGRESFGGYRNMLGCYFDRDEWESRRRVLRESLD